MKYRIQRNTRRHGEVYRIQIKKGPFWKTLREDIRHFDYYSYYPVKYFQTEELAVEFIKEEYGRSAERVYNDYFTTV